MSNRLLLGGAMAGPIFVLVFLIAGATRDGYDPLRHPVSSLQLGPSGWVQVGNFVLAGLLLIGLGAGLFRAIQPRAILGPLLIALAGVGLIGAGVFATDPVSGYPPGTPDELTYSPSGTLHDSFSMLFFLGLPLTCLLLVRRPGGRWWSAYSLVTAGLFLVGFILAGVGFSQEEPFVAVGGLFQRITVVLGFAWLTALALRVRRNTREG